MKISRSTFIMAVLAVATAESELRALKGHKKDKLELLNSPGTCIGFPAGIINGSAAKLVPCANAPHFRFDHETLQLKVIDKSLPKKPQYCLDATGANPQVVQCSAITDQKWAGIRVPNSDPAIFTILSLSLDQTLEDDGAGNVSIGPHISWLSPANNKRFAGLHDHFFC